MFVSRTAWDGAHSFHDANYLTFHRIENFRDKTRKDDAPWLGTEIMNEQDTKDFFVEGTFSDIGTFDDGQKAFANRDYVWGNVPERFKSWKFTRLRGGEREGIRLTLKNA